MTPQESSQPVFCPECLNEMSQITGDTMIYQAITTKESLVSNRRLVLDAINQKLKIKNQTIAQAIAERGLYFRVSIIGDCNLHCLFCHNEGAPTKGKLYLEFAIKAMTEAFNIGFRRVQFTGGEPLLNPQVAEFVKEGRKIFKDVGITTNGTYLERRIESLIAAGISRIHLSLQVETLKEAGHNGRWGIPNWLAPVLKLASEGRFLLRLNMPIPANEMLLAKEFLEAISIFGCDIKVFSILPEGLTRSVPYPIEKLKSLVLMENERRAKAGLSGRVFLRGYKPPVGIRCGSCKAFRRCKEQSHSLRLGADRVLRPCLATREWDELAVEENLRDQIKEATLFALDYVW